MPQVIDTLYTDLELRTQKFDDQVRAADQQIADLGKQLDTKLPNATVVASRSVSKWSESLSRSSEETAEKLRRAIDRTILKLEQQADAVERADRKEIASLTKKAAAAQERFRNLGATSDQMAGIAAVLTTLGAKADAAGTQTESFGQRGQRAALSVASGIETMARVGTEGIGSLKGGISSLAGALGPGGILAGALVFALTATIEYFSRAKAESEKAKRKILDDLQETYLAQQRDRSPIETARGRQNVALGEIAALTDAINKQREARERNLAAALAADKEDAAIAGALRDKARADADAIDQLQAKRRLASQSYEAAIREERSATEGVKDAEAQRYGALLRGQQATRAEQEYANQLVTRYRAELAATTGADRDAQEKRIALLGRISALTGETVKQSERRQASEVRSDELLTDSKKNLVDQFEDLTAAAQRGDVTFVEYARRMRDLGDKGQSLVDRFRAAKEDTTGLANELAQLTARATTAGDALRGIEAQRLADHFEQVAASLTATRTDDLVFGMKQFRQEVERLKTLGTPVDPEAVARVVALQQQLLENTQAEEAAEERIRAILQRKISTFDAQLALQFELTQLKAQEATLAGDDEVTQLKRAELRALIAKYEAEIAKLTGDTAARSKALVDESQAVAEFFEKASAAAYGIATAIFGADSATVKWLGGLSSVASGYRDVVRLAGEAAAKAKLLDPNSTASGFSALFGSTGGLASALPAIGAIVGGLGALGAFGNRTDPAAEQRRKEHQENLAALRAIEKHTGDLVNVRASGRELTAIEGALGQVLKSGVVQFIESRQTGRRQKLEQQAAAGAFSATSLDGLSKATGLSVKELQEIAASMGVTLNGTVESFRLFQEQLLKSDLSAFVDGFAGQLRRLEIEARLDPKAFEGIAGVIKRLQVLAGPNGAPAIAAALGDLEKLKTGEGREDAIARLVALMRNIEGLTKADLGDLNLSQFVEEILDAIDALRGLDGKAKSASESFAEQLEAIGTAFEFGAITLDQRLTRTKAAIAALFPELAASLDFSSTDALQASIQRMVDGFTADGIVTEAEAQQIAALRALKAALDASAAATLDAEEAAKRKAEADAEAARQAEEEARRAAEEAREAAKRELEERRRRIFRLADAKISANDVDDPIEQLRIRMAAVIEAFPGLTDQLLQFDLATQEGRDALEAYLQTLVESPAELQTLADQLGISFDDLLAILLELEGGADSAKEHIRTLAEELEQAFADVDFSLALEGVTDPIERLIRIAKAAGAADTRIQKALEGLDLTSEGGRRSAEALLIALGKSVTGSGADDQALRDAILRILEDLRDVPPGEVPGAPGAAAPRSELGARGPRSESASVAVLAEDLRFSRLLDIEGQQVALLGDIRALLGGGRLVAPPSLPAGFGSSYGSGGAPGTVSLTVINQITTTPTQSPQETAQAATDGTMRGIEAMMGRSLTARRALAGRSEMTT